MGRAEVGQYRLGAHCGAGLCHNARFSTRALDFVFGARACLALTDPNFGRAAVSIDYRMNLVLRIESVVQSLSFSHCVGLNSVPAGALQLAMPSEVSQYRTG